MIVASLEGVEAGQVRFGLPACELGQFLLSGIKGAMGPQSAYVIQFLAGETSRPPHEPHRAEVAEGKDDPDASPLGARDDIVQGPA